MGLTAFSQNRKCSLNLKSEFCLTTPKVTEPKHRPTKITCTHTRRNDFYPIL